MTVSKHKATSGSDTRRVLHMVWNLIRGGTEGQCARVAMALGHRVVVSRREGYFLEAVGAACGSVYEMKISRLVGFETLHEVRRLAAFIRDENFGLIHAWDADAAIFGSWAARIAGVPYITSRRDLGQIYSSRKALLMNQADRGASAIVTNAEAIRRHLFGKSRMVSRVRVIPNILDVDEFDAQAAGKFSRSGELPPGRRVVMVARLDAEKDGGTFVRAAAKINLPDVSFVVAGDGGEREPLEKLAAGLNLGSRMKFLGDVTDVPALLRECSVGVLVPKSNEGLSNSILEYMAAGLPVVATDCGGNCELVENKTSGFVVPPGDADAVADSIVRILNNGTGAMGKIGRRRVESRHRPEIVAAEFAKLYGEVLRP